MKIKGRTPNDKFQHAGTKPKEYDSEECDYCGERFRLKASLIKHIKNDCFEYKLLLD